MKKRRQRLQMISLLLMLVLFVQALSLPIQSLDIDELQTETVESLTTEAAPEVETEMIWDDEATIDTPVSEVIDRREENVKHFDLGYGQYQAVSYGSPVHRKDADGRWQDIDNRLLPTDDRSSAYATLDGRTILAATANTSGALMTLCENGYTLSMTPVVDASHLTADATTTADAVDIRNHSVKTAEELKNLTVANMAEVSNTTKATYRNVFPSTDLEYVLTGNDIKENIIVKAPQSTYEYAFILRVTGLVPQMEDSGRILLCDAETEAPVYEIPAPYMYDADGNVSYDVHYELVGGKGVYGIRVIADADWMNAAGRAFPVTVDPTVQHALWADTYINADLPMAHHGYTQALWVSATKITFMRSVSLPSLPSGCIKRGARLYVYYYYDDHINFGSTTVGAYLVRQAWQENSLTWDLVEPTTNNYIDSSRLSTSVMLGTEGATEASPCLASFNIDYAVSVWMANSLPNYGVALKYESGNSSVKLKAMEAGTQYRAYVTVTYSEPVIESGVYKIKNAQNGLYLDVKDGGVTSGTAVQQWSGTSTDNNLNQLFKITLVESRVGEANWNYYSIRPMVNSGLGLGTGFTPTTRNAVIETVPVQENWDLFLYNNLWSITEANGAYVLRNGNLNETSYLTAPNNTTNGALIYTADDNTAQSKWVLEPCTGVDLGRVVWTDSTSSMRVDETFRFQAYMYDSDINVNGPVIYTVVDTDGSDTDKATMNSSTGLLTALKPGQVIVRTRYVNSGTIWYGYVTIGESIEGTYFIKNRHYETYVQVDDDDAPSYINSGGIIEGWNFDGGNYQRWELVHVGDGYYHIISDVSGYAITVPPGSETANGVNLVLRPTRSIDNQKWKITLTPYGSYKIKAKSSEGYTNEDLVLDTEVDDDYPLGLNIQQKNYVNNESYRDEWLLTKYAKSYVHYYDKSFNDPTLIQNITLANEFANKVFLYYGLEMHMDGSATYYEDALTNDCDASGACTSVCGSDCDTSHHKNIHRISLQLYNSPRETEHIYVLWTDWGKGTYCKEVSGDHTAYDAIACVCDNRPVTNFMYIAGSTPEEQLACMCIVLAHETAHMFGMPDVYDNPGHDDGLKQCIMEKFDEDTAYDFYRAVLSGVEYPFCQSCDSAMYYNHMVNTTIPGNYDPNA